MSVQQREVTPSDPKSFFVLESIGEPGEVIATYGASAHTTALTDVNILQSLVGTPYPVSQEYAQHMFGGVPKPAVGIGMSALRAAMDPASYESKTLHQIERDVYRIRRDEDAAAARHDFLFRPRTGEPQVIFDKTRGSLRGVLKIFSDYKEPRRR